jgi:DeoR/GlpR family transcriptional regulator of sugar metabolism
MNTKRKAPVEASRIQQQISRHQEIVRLVTESGKVGLAELATHLDVSEETIRRDVRELDRLGKLRKVHGGVIGIEAGGEPEFQIRLRHDEFVKKKMAAALAQSIWSDDSVIFGTGSTAYYAASALRSHEGLLAVTNCVEIARLFTARSTQRVLLAGGELRPGDGAALGPQAIAFMEQVRVRWAVLSIDGLDADGVLTVSNLADADYLRCIMKQAEKIAVLISPDKVLRRSVIQLGQLRQVDLLICAAPLPPSLHDQVTNNGGRVVCVG